MKKVRKRIVLTLVCAVLLFGIVMFASYFSVLRAVFSLTRIDDYPIYSITYQGDYDFDDFLKTGARTNADIESFVTDKLKTKWIPFNLTEQGDSCSAFVARTEEGDVIYGRNFDWTYSPTLQVFANPSNDYASVSTVDLSYLGYDEDNLPDDSFLNKFMTVAGPYLPFDGMNENGVAISFLAVTDESIPPYDANKVSLTNVTAIRLVLDKAASVEEAITLLQSYNMSFEGEGGQPVHFLIADATGDSAIIEYWDDELQVIRSEEPFQCVTNYIVYDGLNVPEDGIGETGNEFVRYDTIYQYLLEKDGVISEQEAIDLLISVAGTDRTPPNQSPTQWSVVYNLTKGTGMIFAGGSDDNIHTFSLS